METHYYKPTAQPFNLAIERGKFLSCYKFPDRIYSAEKSAD